MTNKTNFDFVEYLDNYKSKRQCRYSEYIKMVTMINENYEYNNISHQNFTGELLNSMNGKLNNNSYYMIHSNSNWNTINKRDSIDDSCYSLWKSHHETDINKLLDETEKNDIVIEKVNIDTKIENLNDLIKIIDENEYKPYTEYNIDLKALHNIKKELIDLNNMIGMTNLKNNKEYFLKKSGDDYF